MIMPVGIQPLLNAIRRMLNIPRACSQNEMIACQTTTLPAYIFRAFRRSVSNSPPWCASLSISRGHGDGSHPSIFCTDLGCLPIGIECIAELRLTCSFLIQRPAASRGSQILGGGDRQGLNVQSSRL